jgi:hypothetical protein
VWFIAPTNRDNEIITHFVDPGAELSTTLGIRHLQNRILHGHPRSYYDRRIIVRSRREAV